MNLRPASTSSTISVVKMARLMLFQLTWEAAALRVHRGFPSCVLSFPPSPLCADRVGLSFQSQQVGVKFAGCLLLTGSRKCGRGVGCVVSACASTFFSRAVPRSSASPGAIRGSPLVAYSITERRFEETLNEHVLRHRCLNSGSRRVPSRYTAWRPGIKK